MEIEYENCKIINFYLNYKNIKSKEFDMQMDKDKQVIHKLKCISVISFIFMTVEIMGGIMANSIAILADAFHLLSDVLAYIISLQAVLLSHKIPPFFMTFGYEKVQPLGALINVAIIWFVTLELVIQATQRIINKSVVEDPLYMLLTSFFGLGCNLYIMKVLHSDVEHGGHQGCSHAHGLEHHQDHGHDHKHEHKHEHKHGQKCSHGHGHSHSGEKKKAAIKQKKKCNHEHGHHQQHDHNHNHKHGQHSHQQHDHKQEDEGHSHSHHQHGPSCSHSHNHIQKRSPSSDSARQINCYQNEKQNTETDAYKPSITLSQESLNEEINLNAHITYKPEVTEENLSDDSLRIARKEQARKELFANINIQAAYVHIISDIILSIGVIISAIIIYFNADREQWTYWQLADPFCTYLFSVMAIYSTVGIAKDSIIILLDGCDDANMLKEIIGQLDLMDDIESYNELRVWSLNRAKFAAAVKIHLSKSKFNDHAVRDQIRDRVVSLFSIRGISHYVQISEQPSRQLKSE